MTQEEKQLLLIDLSARLPYKVYAQISDEYCDYTSAIESIDIDGFVKDFEGVQIEIEKIKPYLFPLSSMTSKQRAELSMLVANEYDMLKSFLIEIEFYHKHHFDYRGLIEKGLAIDCTNLNIY